jgi:hypothetical protein
VRRRLLERLQQGVERRRAQHVHLVDQVDAELAVRREKTDILPQITDLLDAIVARAVNLEHIKTVTRRDFAARIALAAGRFGRTLCAVERFGEDPRRRGFAHSTRTDEQVGVGQAFTLDGVAQGAHHGILPENFLEQLRTVFAGENLVTHGRNLNHRSVGCGEFNDESDVFR